MNRLLTAMLVGLLASAVPGCGGDGEKVPATSGVLGSRTFATLTPSERTQFCDWLAAKNGGYGKSMMCPNGETRTNDLNQAMCLASLPTCGLTVTEYEICANIVLAVPLCDQENKLITVPECVDLLACFT